MTDPVIASSAPAPSILRPCAKASIRRHFAMSLALSTVLVVGVGGWAALTEIHGAVIAPGQLVVASEVKEVQHPTSGVVGALLVREGDRVKAGDVLIRLDATRTQANLDIFLEALDEFDMRGARFEAERDEAATIAVPAELRSRQASDPSVACLIDGETRLFAARRAGRAGQKAQLSQRIA